MKPSRPNSRAPLLALLMTTPVLAAPAAGALPGDAGGPANALLLWTNDGGKGTLHAVLDLGVDQTVLWTAEFAFPIDGASAGIVGPLGPVAVVGRHATSGSVIEIRDLLTGTVRCEAALPWPHVGGNRVEATRFAFEDVDGIPGNEVLAVGGDHRGGVRTHAAYALNGECLALRNVAGAASSTGSDAARMDAHAWADATGDGRTDAIVMLGASQYPGGQPTIEVTDLAAGVAAVRVQDSFTGSGMTDLAVGRFTGGPGLDFVTGGWWGPRVALYDETGARRWSGDASGTCGSADHGVLTDPVTNALFIGSGSYSRCSPSKVYRVDPATGNVLWSQAGDEAARDFQPVAVGDFDGDGDRELVAMHTDVPGCPQSIATYVLDAATGAKNARSCAGGPVIHPDNARALPAIGAPKTALYASLIGPTGACPAATLCLARVAHDLAMEWAVPLVATSAWPEMEAAAILLPPGESSPVLAEAKATRALVNETLDAVLATIPADGGLTRDLVDETGRAIEAVVPDRTAALVAPVVELDGDATRHLVEGVASDLLAAIPGDGGATRELVNASARALEATVPDRTAERLEPIVALEGEATRSGIAAAREEILATIPVDGQATRQALAGAREEVLAAVPVDGARTRERVASEGAVTRGAVAEARDWISDRIAELGAGAGDGFDRLEEAVAGIGLRLESGLDALATKLDGISRDVGAGIDRVAADLDDLSRRFGARFDALGARLDGLGDAISARFDRVDGKVGDVQSALDELRATEPLAITLSPSTAARETGAGDVGVLVTLRGQPVDARVEAALDADSTPPVAVLRRAPGVYVARLDAPAVASPATLLLVRAELGRHAGASLVWIGAGAVVAGGEALAAGETAAAEASARGAAAAGAALGEADAAVLRATTPPEGGKPVERVVLDEIVDLPETRAGAPATRADLVTFEGAPAGDGLYRIRVGVPGGQGVEATLITGPLALPPQRISLLETHPAEASAPGASVHLRVSYRHDATSTTCARAADVACAPLPSDPTRPMWAAGPGQATALVIEASLVASNGTVIASETVEVPVAGQLAGWARGIGG